MDWLTFTSKLIDSLAWPVAVLGLSILLRDPVSRILLNVRRLRYRDAEFDFGNALAEAGANSLKTEAPVTEIPQTQLRLAELSPRGAVIEAWLDLEEALGNVAEKVGIARTRPGGLPVHIVPVDSFTLAQQLLLSGRLSVPSFERLQKLKKIRNTAINVTDEAISPSEAEAFIRLVAELKLELRASTDQSRS